MSVKEFFAFSSIKPTVLEFLRSRADFPALERKFKKPFRAYINKHSSVQGQRNAPANQVDDDQLLDFFVSDGFHSIKCLFSERCKERFGEVYPGSVKIASIVNMLICVQSFRVEMRAPFALADQKVEAEEDGAAQTFESSLYKLNAGLVKSMEVVLLVDELRVISFDRFGMKMPSSLAFDDQVRSHLNVMRHFLMKQLILRQ